MFAQFNFSARLTFACALLILLSGCASYKLWPFTGDKASTDPTLPENAVAYHCSSGKKFYVRELDKGQAIWLILPDREFSLSKQSAEGLVYSNGVTNLALGQSSAVLEISPSQKWLDCVRDQPVVNK